AKATVASSIAFACWPAHARSATCWGVAAGRPLRAGGGKEVPDALAFFPAPRRAGVAAACDLGMSFFVPLSRGKRSCRGRRLRGRLSGRVRRLLSRCRAPYEGESRWLVY